MEDGLLCTAILVHALGYRDSLTKNDIDMIQKEFFLLNYLGLRLRYFHCWYFSGAYCSELSEDIYSLPRNYVPEYSLPDDYRHMVDCVIGIKNWEIPQPCSSYQKYQLTAGVAFWKEYGLKIDEIIVKLQDYLPVYTSESIRYCHNKLCKTKEIDK